MPENTLQTLSSRFEGSILDYLKVSLGIPDDDTSFDPEITTLGTGVFGKLAHLGVKVNWEYPTVLYSWQDAFHVDPNNLMEYFLIQEYFYISIRLSFDPSASKVIQDTMIDRLKEVEWRLVEVSDEH